MSYDPYLLEMKMECVLPAVLLPIIEFQHLVPCWTPPIPVSPEIMISGLETVKER